MLPSGILICCTGPFWSNSLCLFGFCLPSLRCLISTLAQARRGDLLFRFASSVQSCCGEGGALQTDIIALCGENSPCSGHTGFAPYRGVCAFPMYTAKAPGCSIWSGPWVECGSSFLVLHNSMDSVAPACCVFPGLSGSGSQRLACFLPGLAHLFLPQRAAQAARGSGGLSPGAACLLRWVAQAARGLAHSPWVRRTFSLCGPWARRQSGLRKSLDRNWGPVCSVGGGGFSGAEFAPFPSPLPPSSSGDGPALLWSFSVLLFCEPPAVCSGQLIFPCYPTV